MRSHFICIIGLGVESKNYDIAVMYSVLILYWVRISESFADAEPEQFCGSATLLIRFSQDHDFDNDEKRCHQSNKDIITTATPPPL
jgi:hypothetical protein